MSDDHITDSYKDIGAGAPAGEYASTSSINNSIFMDSLNAVEKEYAKTLSKP